MIEESLKFIIETEGMKTAIECAKLFVDTIQESEETRIAEREELREELKIQHGQDSICDDAVIEEALKQRKGRDATWSIWEFGFMATYLDIRLLNNGAGIVEFERLKSNIELVCVENNRWKTGKQNRNSGLKFSLAECSSHATENPPRIVSPKKKEEIPFYHILESTRPSFRGKNRLTLRHTIPSQKIRRPLKHKCRTR